MRYATFMLMIAIVILFSLAIAWDRTLAATILHGQLSAPQTWERHTRVRLMARLGGALNLREVAFAKLAPEQIQRHSVDGPCGGRIVSSAFVSHECVGAGEFLPAEICSSVGQCIVNRCPTFPGNVRVLPTKHDQEFAPDLRDSIERVIVQAFAQTPLVDVGRVTAGCCEHFGVDR